MNSNEENDKCQSFVNQFQNWLCMVSVKNACRWYLKWNVLIFIVLFISLLCIPFLGIMDYERGLGVIGVIYGVLSVLLAFIFNYIIIDRIMYVKRKVFLSNLFSNAIVLNVFMSLPDLKNAIEYMSLFPYLIVIPSICLLIYFCVIHQYCSRPINFLLY